MRDRSVAAPRAGGGHTVDVVTLTANTEQLLVRCTLRDEKKKLWEIPWSVPRSGETLEHTARRIARASGSTDPAWVEQIGAFADRTRHPAAARLSVGFVAVIPVTEANQSSSSDAWLPAERLPLLLPRQRTIVEAALGALRARLDRAPIPFRLLPTTFTLGDLQRMYELLLGHRLHKASFRRSLHAAWLVEPTDEWRNEGRGRPAQLFRFAPRKRRDHRRGVRFDLL